jgi:hypothetical protein
MDLAKIVKQLLKDAEIFTGYARDAKKEGSIEIEGMYSRAAIFASWSALEGWVNYVCSDFSKLDNDKINLWEQAFLSEKRVEISEEGTFLISSQDNFQPTSTKLCFLFTRFGGYSFRKNRENLWSDLKKIEDIRNSIVHPSSGKKEILVNCKIAEEALNVTKQTVELLKDKIYHKK